MGSQRVGHDWATNTFNFVSGQGPELSAAARIRSVSVKGLDGSQTCRQGTRANLPALIPWPLCWLSPGVAWRSLEFLQQGSWELESKGKPTCTEAAGRNLGRSRLNGGGQGISKGSPVVTLEVSRQHLIRTVTHPWVLLSEACRQWGWVVREGWGYLERKSQDELFEGKRAEVKTEHHQQSNCQPENVQHESWEWSFTWGHMRTAARETAPQRALRHCSKEVAAKVNIRREKKVSIRRSI